MFGNAIVVPVSGLNAVGSVTMECCAVEFVNEKVFVVTCVVFEFSVNVVSLGDETSCVVGIVDDIGTVMCVNVDACAVVDDGIDVVGMAAIKWRFYI